MGGQNKMDLKYVKIKKDDHLAHYGVKGMRWRTRSNGVLDSPGLYKIRSGGNMTGLSGSQYNTMLNEFDKSYDAPRGTGNPMEIDREKTKHAYERALNRKFKENPFKTSMETIGQFAKGKISKAKNWIVSKMANWYSSTRANNRG